MPTTLARPRATVAAPLTSYTQAFMDLRGGMNNSLSDEVIADNETPLAMNYIPDIFSGMLIKREGVTRYLATQQAEAFTGIYDGVTGNYFSTSTKIKLFDDTSIASGLTTSTDPAWASMNGWDIYTDGINNVQKLNGVTTGALGGSPPKFKDVIEFKQMLFGIGHDGGSMRWTDQFTTETWNSGREYVFSDNSDNDGVGFGKYRDSLIVFLQREFHQIQASSHLDVNVVYSNWEEGTTSHRSIVSTPYGVFFWTQNGLAMTDGQDVQYPMLMKLPDTLADLNRAKDSLVHGVWNPTKRRVQYYLFNNTSQTENLAVYYYPVSGAFWVEDGAGTQMGASGRVKISGATDVYLGSASTNGYLYQNTGDTDDGVAIAAYWETKRFSTEFGPVAVKRSRDVALLFETDTDITLTLYVYYDNSTFYNDSWSIVISGVSGFTLDVDQLDVGVLGGSSESKEESVNINQKFTKMKFRVSDGTTSRSKIRGLVARGLLVAA